jgi:hypothetical protein
MLLILFIFLKCAGCLTLSWWWILLVLFFESGGIKIRYVSDDDGREVGEWFQ